MTQYPEILDNLIKHTPSYGFPAFFMIHMKSPQVSFRTKYDFIQDELKIQN
jgi:hypothetical protein